MITIPSILQKKILYQEVVLVVIVKIYHQGVLLQLVQEVVSRSSSPINNGGIDPKIFKHYFGFNSLNEIYKILNEDSVDKTSNTITINQAMTNLKTHIQKFLKREKKLHG